MLKPMSKTHQSLNQPRLSQRRTDKSGEKRVRIEGAALEFGVELHADNHG